MVTAMDLDQSGIHVWLADQADFDPDSLARRCLSWLSSEETRRYRRLQLARHRTQFLLGRYFVRTVLSRYVESVAPAAWCFTVNDYGKPAIDPARHDAALYYNLSHSQGRLALAVARQPTLGIDIEGCTRPRRVSRIATRYFSTDEVQALLQLDEAAQLERFYELWTLKEAYIKACGLGLAIPLQQFGFALDTPGKIRVQFSAEREDIARAWRFWQLDIGAGHRLALALKGGQDAAAPRLSLRDFSGEHEAVARPPRVLRSG